MNKGITIIVPAFNEENAITPVLEKLVADMGNTNIPHEILVIDDGSSDTTAQKVSAVAGVTLYQHRANRGYGASLKTGIRHAKHPYVVITDADGTYPNHRIPDLLNMLHEKDADMVVGARTGEDVQIPLLRRPPKWVLRKLANYVTGETIPDLNSGLRMFDRDVARRMLPMLSDKFSFTTTITLAMMSNGYIVEFMPINYYSRVGKSKIRPIQDTLNFANLVLSVGLYFAPLKIFLPLSAFLFLLGVGWGLFSFLFLEHLFDESMLLLMLSGMQIGALGLLAQLINKRSPNFYRKEEIWEED